MDTRNKKLKKSELLKRVSQHTHLRTSDIQIILDAYYLEVRKALTEGKKVRIPDCVIIELTTTNRRFCSDFSGNTVALNPEKLVPRIRPVGILKAELSKDGIKNRGICDGE